MTKEEKKKALRKVKKHHHKFYKLARRLDRKAIKIIKTIRERKND